MSCAVKGCHSPPIYGGKGLCLTHLNIQLKENADKGKQEMIKVVVRVRPLDLTRESPDNQVEVDPHSGRVLVALPQSAGKQGTTEFAFDEVFSTDSTQTEIYEFVAKDLISDVLNGYNATIFAYGQTGSGKTFTMEGNIQDKHLRGIMPNAFIDFFDQLEMMKAQYPKRKFLVRASFLQIYQNFIYDLIGSGPDSKGELVKLNLRESKDQGVYVENLTIESCQSSKDVTNILARGSQRRKTACTAMNNTSSRSHSVLTIIFETAEKDEKTGLIDYKVGKLTMVDLAGSERQKKSNAVGDRLKEATTINMSLSALGNVIKALAEHDGKKKSSSKSQHIPYRDSTLTRILQDSLGGNTRTVMIANIGPAAENVAETLNTLGYADRVKSIKVSAKVNDSPHKALCMLKQEQEQLDKKKKEEDEIAAKLKEAVEKAEREQRKKEERERRLAEERERKERERREREEALKREREEREKRLAAEREQREREREKKELELEVNILKEKLEKEEQARRLSEQREELEREERDRREKEEREERQKWEKEEREERERREKEELEEKERIEKLERGEREKRQREELEERERERRDLEAEKEADKFRAVEEAKAALADSLFKEKMEDVRKLEEELSKVRSKQKESDDKLNAMKSDAVSKIRNVSADLKNNSEMLMRGSYFVKHAHRFLGSDVQEKLVFYEGSTVYGWLCWCKPGVRKQVKEKMILMSTIVSVLEGKVTQNLNRKSAKKADPDHCFSVLTASRVLDLEAGSKEERDAWVKAIRMVALSCRNNAFIANGLPFTRYFAVLVNLEQLIGGKQPTERNIRRGCMKVLVYVDDDLPVDPDDDDDFDGDLTMRKRVEKVAVPVAGMGRCVYWNIIGGSQDSAFISGQSQKSRDADASKAESDVDLHSLRIRRKENRISLAAIAQVCLGKIAPTLRAPVAVEAKPTTCLSVIAPKESSVGGKVFGGINLASEMSYDALHIECADDEKFTNWCLALLKILANPANDFSIPILTVHQVFKDNQKIMALIEGSGVSGQGHGPLSQGTATKSGVKSASSGREPSSRPSTTGASVRAPGPVASLPSSSSSSSSSAISSSSSSNGDNGNVDRQKFRMKPKQ